MPQILLYFVIILSIVLLIHMIRLSIMYKLLFQIIDDVYERRMKLLNSSVKYSDVESEIESIVYPNISATYSNLKWYKPWERPSTLIIYDKD